MQIRITIIQITIAMGLHQAMSFTSIDENKYEYGKHGQMSFETWAGSSLSIPKKSQIFCKTLQSYDFRNVSKFKSDNCSGQLFFRIVTAW